MLRLAVVVITAGLQADVRLGVAVPEELFFLAFDLGTLH